MRSLREDATWDEMAREYEEYRRKLMERIQAGLPSPPYAFPAIDNETNKIIKPESNPIFSKPLPLP